MLPDNNAANADAVSNQERRQIRQGAGATAPDAVTLVLGFVLQSQKGQARGVGCAVVSSVEAVPALTSAALGKGALVVRRTTWNRP